MPTNIQICETEVIELHAFFQSWFRGDLLESPQGFARFEEAIAEDFKMITPGGVLCPRPNLVEGLLAAHGKQSATKIWIENTSTSPLAEGLWLTTYEEWQGGPGEERGRLSSAIFRTNPKAPNGIEWVHLHEVWLPAKAPIG